MKFIEIILTKKDLRTNRKEVDRCLITDFMAVTRYSDPNKSFQIYNQKRKEGKQNVAWTRGVLTEEYPDTKKEEIKKMMIEQIELLKEKMKKELVISYVITEKEK